MSTGLNVKNFTRLGRWSGMTLVELLATMTILALVTTASIPSFRSLVSRQSLRSAQQQVESSFFEMKRFTLAPPENVTMGTIVGYGLVVFHHGSKPAGSLNLFGCDLTLARPTDFLTYAVFVRSSDGSGTITPRLLVDDGSGSCRVETKRFASQFIFLPNNVEFVSTASFPWLVAEPLQAAGQKFGQLPLPAPFTDPLLATGEAKLLLRHASLRVDGQRVCRSIELRAGSTGVETHSRLAEGGCG